MTFTQLLDGYAAYLKPKPSWKNYRNLRRKYFTKWTTHPTFTQVNVWHRSLSQTPEQANKALSFLKSAYAWGLRSGQHTGLNFAVGVKAYSSQSRERMMDSFEVARVVAALDAMPPKPSALLVVLLTTGCRLSEALRMEPEHVNLLTGQWTQFRTKNKKTHVTYLPTQARAALAQLAPGVRFYFKSRDPGRMYTVDNAEKAWNKVRKDLELQDVRLHDFRRTWSTHCYRATKDLALVKRCINHVSKDVTMIYVRFTFDEIRAVMQAQADRFWALAPPRHQANTTMPVPAQLTQPVIAPAVVVPMMSAPVPIVHRSQSVEREEWPG